MSKDDFNEPLLEAQIYKVILGRNESISIKTLDTQDRKWGILPKLKSVHVISDPAIIKELLHTPRGGDFVESGFHEDLDEMIGVNNMLLSPHAQHQRLRAPFIKFFSTKNSREMLAKIVESALYVFKNFEENSCLPRQFVLEVLDSSILGIDENHRRELQAIVNNNFENLQQLDQFIAKIFTDKGFNADLALDLIDKSENLTEEEKISAAKLILTAGFETTTNFIDFFSIFIAAHIQHKENIAQEWKEFSREEFLSRDDLLTSLRQFVTQSKWLEACYLETLRLAPVIPAIKRIAKKNLQIGNVMITAGDEIHLNLFAAQRNQEQWGEDSKCFKPERFLGKSGAEVLSFSMGPQSCIGKNIAKLESKVFIALFAIFFELKPNKLRNYEAFTLKQRNNLENCFQYEGFALQSSNWWNNLDYFKFNHSLLDKLDS